MVITMLELFLVFLKIGAVSFGGGYGMISLIKEECLSRGWLTEPELLNFIGVAESTPGPIAVNMATFVGSSQEGFLGALFATLGVVLPSFIIILVLVSLISGLLKYAGVKAFINGVKPSIIGLILATSVTLFISIMLSITQINNSTINIEYKSLIIFALIVFITIIYKKIFKENISPILLILISGIFGIILYI